MRLLLDILLLPKGFYQRITGSKATLYIGMLFVGFSDLLVPYMVKDYARFFTGKPVEGLLFQGGLTLLLCALVGALDVIVFSVPLFDFFKRFKKEEGVVHGDELLNRLMKVYISVHILYLPVNLIYYYLTKDIIDSSPLELISAAAYAYIFITIWFNAAITRGMNAVNKFDLIFRKLVFPSVFIWGMLAGMAVSYVIENWVAPLIQ